MTTNKQRFVLDTNLLVSAILQPKSVTRQVVDYVLEHGVLLQSLMIAVELEEVLRRPKFNKYLSEDERLDFLAALGREAVLIDVRTTITDCRDPKDNKFLELAVDGQADYLVTGDQDLLVLHPFRNIQIITPRTLLDTEK